MTGVPVGYFILPETLAHDFVDDESEATGKIVEKKGGRCRRIAKPDNGIVVARSDVVCRREYHFLCIILMQED